VALTFSATAAWADTSTATANALNLQLGTASIVNSGTVSASNPGGQPTVTNSGSTLNLLGAQSTITAGLLAQTAVAFGDGSSAACAGLVGAGGSIQIGNDGTCAVSGGGAGGITIVLPNLVTLRATAILEECFASSTGTPTAQSQFVDATLTFAGQTLATIPVNPAPGTTQSALLLSLGLNNQSTPQTGEIQATALSLSVLNTINLSIGNVTCGPNVQVAGNTSVMPAKSLPIAAGVLGLMAVVAVPWYRRRQRLGRA
jgi:hypothetical protein